MRRYSGIRGQDVEDGGVPIDIGIDTTGLHRLELRTKTPSRSDTLSDTGSSILRPPSPADVTHVAGSCGTNSMNFNPSSAEVYSFNFDYSNSSMSTSCFTELLSQKIPQDTLNAQSIPRPRRGRGSAEGNSEGITLAISQRRCPTPEYFIPDFGLSDSTMALNPRFRLPARFHIPARFSRLLREMALDVSLFNFFMKMLQTDISTFASQYDCIQWPTRLETRNAEYGWTTLPSVDTSLHLMKPIYLIAEDILCDGVILKYFEVTDANDHPMALCQDQRLLELFFSVVLHLISNNTVGARKVSSFLRWVTEMDILDQLAIFLKINPRDADALLEATACQLNLDLTKDIGSFRGSGRGVQWWEQLIDLFDDKGLEFSKEVSSSLLHAIARTSAISSARILLAHGADINFTAPIRHAHYVNGKRARSPIPPLGPPLFRALYSHMSGMVEFLIQAGCDINHCYMAGPSERSCNALSISISENMLSCADFLLKKGARIPASIKVDLGLLRASLNRDFNEGKYAHLRQWMLRCSPLIDIVVEAAGVGSTELSKVLLKYNILQEAVLECALRRAVGMNNALAVQTLLQRGVDANPRPCQIKCSELLGIDDAVVGVAPICLVDHRGEEGQDIICLLLRAGAYVPDQFLFDIPRQDRGDSATTLYTLSISRTSMAPVFGASALEYAAQEGNLSICSYLLDLKAPLNYHGACGMSCLQRAASKGYLLLTRFLLEHGADVNLAAHVDGGRTALQGAVESGSTLVIECLLNAGANIKAAPAKRNGLTVLEAFAKCKPLALPPLMADREGEYQALKMSRFRDWVAMGVPINRPNGDDSSLLHYLVLTFHRECLKSALSLGARIEDRCRVQKYGDGYEISEGTKTPLQLAAHLGQLEAGRLLLEYGADINAVPSDDYGRTTLQAATCNSKGQSDHDMLQLLLSFGPNINAPPAKRGGLTALQGAAVSGDLIVAKMLLERGADINAPAAAEDGRTAIEGAAEHGRSDMVEFLLQNGAKGDPETGFSRAIELAEAEVHLGVANVLREHIAMSELLDFDLTHGASGDLVGPLPSPGFVFSDEALADFNFEMPS
ncbi:hypothetical protein CNYM01_10552 [Colletotrichum nymphaeae SA-01]|uniref:Uncharacterized protein n=1 Tax=Colletotrichum nymphaeae SA-01 TaxID=1460502 RepID=A0A135TXI2_9PEZI|nr:hypothetical protein CNYM01_10552 [Colletotrichum nymphaeae SA-01]